MKYSKGFLLGLYRTMLQIHLCEESLVVPILTREVRCPVHLCSGQEAIAAGVCVALSDKDYMFGTHRSHGHFLAKGGKLTALIAEIYGKDSGCSRGMGGSMHLCAPERGFLGAAPIVAGTIPLALGAALATSIRKEKRVTVSFFGDGATGEGVLFESLNFAALKKLPIIFACENNFYSTHLPIRECRPNNNIARVAEPFCIKNLRVDGNNVLKVYEATKDAARLCRTGRGPVFIEFITYRLRGHVGPDDNIQGTHTDIRPKSEIERWKKKDPVVNLKKFLIRERIATEPELRKIEAAVDREVKAAHDFNQASRYPEKHKLSKYVFR